MGQKYDESKIKVLKGLEGVRKRPSMYIGNVSFTGLHHLIFELIDNAVDEYLAGNQCSKIRVHLAKNNVVCVQDNGRGIPVGLLPDEGKSAVEVIMTTLHSGGKFDSKSYKCSAGLHGVGLSVVNALSCNTTVEVVRDKALYIQKYSKGIATTELMKCSDSKSKEIVKKRKRGTTIKFKYDEEIFGEQEFDIKYISRRCRDISFLSKGLEITVSDFNGFKQVHKYDNGLIDFVSYLNSDRDTIDANGESIISYNIVDIKFNGSEFNLNFAFQYSVDDDDRIFSFVNTINTHDGGTHLNGFKAGLTKALLENISSRKLSGVKVVGSDIIEGLTAVVSVQVQDPEFEGQTKTRLGNAKIRNATEDEVYVCVKESIESNAKLFNVIIDRIVTSAKARDAAKKARTLEKKRSKVSKVVLPGKLTDCISRDMEETELFICEGDSAGGGVKMGRNKNIQAVLPIKGKILNTEKVNLNKILTNVEVKSIFSAIGITFTKGRVNIDGLRYGKIIFLCDADVDGQHISCLLLTLFYKYMRKLIENGHVYIAKPPLYRLKTNKRDIYLDDDEALREFSSGHDLSKYQLSRFKGLGEMMPRELWQTTLDPENRNLIKVEIDDFVEASELFTILMGNALAERKSYIYEHCTFDN